MLNLCKSIDWFLYEGNTDTYWLNWSSNSYNEKYFVPSSLGGNLEKYGRKNRGVVRTLPNI